MNQSQGKPSHRILVIDDNPAIHDDIRKVIQSPTNESPDLTRAETVLFGSPESKVNTLAFEIDSAFQGKEGLAMIRTALEQRRPYAVAFVDMRMPPGWNGLETISRIWEVDSDLQIVLCTAYSDVRWEEILERLGSNDKLIILKKPCDNIELRQVACTLSQKWNLARTAKLRMMDLETQASHRMW